MSALSDRRETRDGLVNFGYATPEAVRHLTTPAASMAYGAFGMLDPFRSSLPGLYRHWATGFADAAALRSDWAMFTLDYDYVVKACLAGMHPGQQSLFDPGETP